MGKLSEDSVEEMRTWSNWEAIYMVFAANPKLWEDWERLLNWILKKSRNEEKVERRKLRNALKVLRKAAGKQAKPQRDTTVLTDTELCNLLNTIAASEKE